MFLHASQHPNQLLPLPHTIAYPTNKLMSEQSLTRPPLSWLFLQTTPNQINQILVLMLQLGRRRHCYMLHRMHMLHPQTGRLALYQLYSHYAQRPNVYFLVVGLFAH